MYSQIVIQELEGKVLFKDCSWCLDWHSLVTTQKVVNCWRRVNLTSVICFGISGLFQVLRVDRAK